MKLKHDGASRSIMIICDVSARRRCCAEAQARGVRGAGSPPGKIDDFPATVFTFRLVAQSRRKPVVCTSCARPFPAGPGEQEPTQTFDGETPSIRPRGDLPPGLFLLRSCSSIPTGSCRQGTPRKQHNNNTTTRWRVSWVPCHLSRPGNFR